MSAIETVRALVHSLRRRPDDVEGRSVLADWCEEHGFEEAMRVLRADLSNETLMTLASFRVLFGEAPDGEAPTAPNMGRYTAAVGLRFPSTRSGRSDFVMLEPGESVQLEAFSESVQLEAFSQVFIKVRRLMFSAAIAGALEVDEIRVGMRTLLASNDPIPGEMCLLSSPEFFEPVAAVPNQPILVRVRNIFDAPVRPSGCVLGDQPNESLQLRPFGAPR